MRVVLDSNVIVAALVFPGGRGDAALQRIINQTDQLVLSRQVLDEVLGVLGRKFARDAEELAHVAVFLSQMAVIVTPKRRLSVVKDDPDNRILECAVAGRADLLVTGDKALLALASYGETRIVSLRDYLEG